MKNNRRYLLVTFIWSFGLWCLAIVMANRMDGSLLQHADLLEALIQGNFDQDMLLPTIISHLATYGPMIAFLSLFLARKNKADLDLKHFKNGFSLKQLMTIVLLFSVITAIPSIPVILLSGIKTSHTVSLPSILVLLILYEIMTSGLEEIGWRGYLLPQYLKTMTPWQASVRLGFVWALWHTPIVLYIFHGQGMNFGQSISSFIGFGAGIVAMSVVHTYFFIKSKSVWLSVMIHGIGNTIPFMFAYFTGESYIVSLSVQLLMWGFVILLTRKEKALFENQLQPVA